MPIVTEGQTQSLPRRSRRAAWLIVGMVAVLLGYPLGFALAATRGWLDAYTWVYAALALVALVAAFAFIRNRPRRLGPY